MNILLLDDSITFRKIINKKLSEKSEINTIFQAKNNSEAMEILENNTIDLIIMDHDRPGGTGYDLFKEIKDKHFFNHIKIIVFTSNVDEINEYKNLGVKDLLSKSNPAKDIILNILSIIEDNLDGEESPFTDNNIRYNKEIINLLNSLADKLGYELVKK